MIVTGGFICEAVNTSDGKLNVLGGVWDWCAVPAVADDRYVVPVKLVVLVQTEREDDNRAVIKVDLLGPGQDVILHADINTMLPAGTNLGFVWASLPLRFGDYGKHVFLISGSSGAPYALPLDVRPA
jgi:hypothetical protein